MKSPQGRVHQGRAPWDKPSLHAQPDLLKIIKKRGQIVKLETYHKIS